MTGVQTCALPISELGGSDLKDRCFPGGVADTGVTQKIRDDQERGRDVFGERHVVVVGPHGGGVWGRVEGKGSDFRHFYLEVYVETKDMRQKKNVG